MFGDSEFRYDIKSMMIKVKLDKSDFVKIKNFCSAKHSAKRMKTSYRLGETVFRSHLRVKKKLPPHTHTHKLVFIIYIYRLKIQT